MQFNILEFLEKYFSQNEPVILACSAGPDSMFLLYEILKTPYRKNLVVCYFNHKLRPEADYEEKFLEKLGEKEGFKVEIGEILPLNSLSHPSCEIGGLEERARKKRYEFFNTILNIYNSNKIILAHHLDDRIETFFFNLIRGSKLTGLINMTEKSGDVLRPLLNVEKKDIQKYLDDNGLKYFIDNSNFDTNITRNKLRLEILPKFEEINGSYKENVSNLINYLEELKQSIDEEVKRFLALPISYNILFPTSRAKKIKTDKKIYVLEPSLLNSPLSSNEDIPPHGGRAIRAFEISAFNFLSSFMQKEVIRYIYFISNGNSTIGLSEANIDEIIRFINGKNNKTIKEIGGLKMKKENTVILW